MRTGLPTCNMFWGVKLEKGKKYSQLVEKSFHISHAALTSCKVKTQCVFEVHVVVENTDYVLCYLGHLNNQLLVQQPLDLNISEGEEIVFYVAKSNGRPDDEIGVYLTGYFREDPEAPFNLDDLLDAEDEDVDDDEVAEEDGEVGNEGEEDLWTALMMNESLSETDSDEDYTINDDLLKNEQGLLLPIKGKPIIEEVAENIPAQRGDIGENTQKRGSKKRKRDKVKDNTDVSELLLKSKSEEVEATPKVKRKKKMDSDGQQQRQETKSASKLMDMTETVKQQKGNKKKAGSLSFVTSGGTQVQELQTGTGRVAKNGKKVFVKYTGRLAHNQKIIDSNLTSKKPFMFRLGQREVITGWDEGLQGMKVGGKRKLCIPPAQGYGSRGSPPKIPPNSKLIFDVELVNVK